jgi:hypothetical protein
MNTWSATALDLVVRVVGCVLALGMALVVLYAMRPR